MDDKKDVKTEVSFFCGICLSVGRILKPLGRYSAIFFDIMKNTRVNEKSSSEIHICWECRAVLHNTWSLRKRALKAWHALQLMQKNCVENLPKESLSTLVTSVLPPNDGITIECKNEEALVDFKEIKCESPSDFDNRTSMDADFYENKNDDLKNKTEGADDDENLTIDFDTIKAEPVSPGTYTAMVKKKGNRGPIKKIKYKLMSVPNVNFKSKSYIKSAIDQNELMKCLAKERSKRHYQNKPYKCETCIMGWMQRESLIQHNKEHHTKGEFICDICNTRCKQKNAIIQHVRKHYIKYTCQICHKELYSSRRIFYHFNRKHLNVSVFECLECGLKFDSRKSFYKHYDRVHRSFECDLCGKRCSTKRQIMRHLQEVHEPWYCKICNIHFKAFRYLNGHNQHVHTKEISEDSYCVECNMQFDNVAKYKRHLTNSVKHKPKRKLSIPCPVCQKVFCKKITMKNHYDLVHLQTTKHYCDLCDRYFLNGWRYRQHKASVHDKIAPLKNKFCEICGRAFAQNRTLINHVRTHTGEKPYECSVCPARFAQRTAMLTHYKAIHLKNKMGQ